MEEPVKLMLTPGEKVFTKLLIPIGESTTDP
jgi:hypothetical protein